MMLGELGLLALQHLATLVLLVATVEACVQTAALPRGPMRRVFSRFALGAALLAIMGICWSLEDLFPLLDKLQDVLLSLGLAAVLWGYASLLSLRLSVEE